MYVEKTKLLNFHLNFLSLSFEKQIKAAIPPPYQAGKNKCLLGNTSTVNLHETQMLFNHLFKIRRQKKRKIMTGTTHYFQL